MDKPRKRRKPYAKKHTDPVDKPAEKQQFRRAGGSVRARRRQEAGHHTSKCGLQGKTLGFCLGCLSCLKTKRCVIPDDAADIVQQMKRADVLVFATPIYYYEMCGQMKTLLDRANPLYCRRLCVP